MGAAGAGMAGLVAVGAVLVGATAGGVAVVGAIAGGVAVVGTAAALAVRTRARSCRSGRWDGHDAAAAHHVDIAADRIGRHVPDRVLRQRLRCRRDRAA